MTAIRRFDCMTGSDLRAVDVGEALGRGLGGVGAGNGVAVIVLGDVDAVAGSVDGDRVAGEGVARSPAVEDAVGLETVLRGIGAGVVEDLPLVALDVHPRLGVAHAL